MFIKWTVQSTMVILLRLYWLTSVLLMVHSYPDGPPKSVCKDGMPVHLRDGKPIPPHNSSSPYVIDVNSTSIKPGETVRVKIHSNQGEMFRGLFLQVHPIPNKDGDSLNYSPVGLFDRKITNIKLMTCTVMLDALSHEDSFMKVETSFDWRAPLFLKHDVVIRATILKSFDTYWHNVESPRIVVIKDETFPVEKLEKPWLEEIIKTVKNENDTKLRRELVKARFEKGFRNAIDPNGFIMINYVTNLLPFEDSPVPLPIYSSKSLNDTDKLLEQSVSNIDLNNQGLPADKKGMQAVNETDLVNQTSIASDNTTNTTKPQKDLKSDNSSQEKLGAKVGDLPAEVDINTTRNNSMMEKYYTVLVRSLLKGDALVADTLSEIIEKR